MWVEFVVGSRPCSEKFFSGYSSFPLSSKINISKFQFDLESEGHRFVSPNRLLTVALVKQSRFIYLFISLPLCDMTGAEERLCGFQNFGQEKSCD